MELKRLCLSLASCNKEKDVIKILKNVDFWDDNSVWNYFGGIENNYATFGGQQDNPEQALVEKLINSVDAVLMLKCLINGIKPDSVEAPSSVKDALIDFFEIHEGKLSNISPYQRTQLATNIALVATGSSRNPCYAIIDRGEGQTPNKMPDTLLSINRSNKVRIPFVQGRFNMGGTGVARFCGKNNVQLIISKRNPVIGKNEKDSSKDEWGFTVVRRMDPTGMMKNSIYKYLAPSNKILKFRSEGLPLLPGDYPREKVEILYWGTYIKLYEYQIPKRYKSNILFDLYNRLSALVPSIALPVRLYERRTGYSGHTFETTLSGLTVRLDEDKRSNLEEGFPTTAALSVGNQKMNATIYAFKKGQSKKYIKNEGVLFSINGQTQGYLPQSFFSKPKVGMDYLHDSILIELNCTQFEARAREELFMNSRDRLASGQLRRQIERNLEELVKHHSGLRELLERRRREEIQEKIGDLKPLTEVLEKIIKVSPTLARLILRGEKITNPFDTRGAAKKDVFEGKFYPTYFTLIEKFPIDRPKNVPKNVRFRVKYNTDSSNDYFNRDNSPGSFLLKFDNEVLDDYSINLWNGIATLNVALPSNFKKNTTFKLTSEVTDVNRVFPINEDFYINVIEPIDEKKGAKGKRTPPSSEKEGDDTFNINKLSVPYIKEIRRDDWEKHEFNEYSTIKIKHSIEHGYDFFINMDNSYLLYEEKHIRDIDTDLLAARYKYGIALIALALLNDLKEDEDAYKEGKNKHISIICNAVAPVLLPMISALGSLDVEEVSV